MVLLRFAVHPLFFETVRSSIVGVAPRYLSNDKYRLHRASQGSQPFLIDFLSINIAFEANLELLDQRRMTRVVISLG